MTKKMKSALCFCNSGVMSGALICAARDDAAKAGAGCGWAEID